MFSYHKIIEELLKKNDEPIILKNIKDDAKCNVLRSKGELLSDIVNSTALQTAMYYASAEHSKQKKITYVRKNGFGRRYADTVTPINLKKNIRAFLCKNRYTDIDMCDAAMSIIRSMMSALSPDINQDCFDYISKNREKMFEDMIKSSNKSISRDDAKKIGYALMFGGNVEHELEKIGCEHMTEVRLRYRACHDGIEDVINKLSVIINLEEIDTASEHNKKYSRFGKIIQHIESKLLDEMYYEANVQDLVVADLQFDGIMISNRFCQPLTNDEAKKYIAACEERFKNAGFGLLKLTVKDFKESDDIKTQLYGGPDAWFTGDVDENNVPNTKGFSAEAFRNLREFPMMTCNRLRKMYFERHFFVYKKFLVQIMDNGEYIEYQINKNLIEYVFGNLTLMVHDEEGPLFLEIYLKCVQKREYSSLEFIPWVNPKDNVQQDDTFNLFRGFKSNLMDRRITEDEYTRNVKWFLDHIHKLIKEDVIAEYIVNWLAYKVQNIDKKLETCIVLYGEHGTGKNSIVDVLDALFGGNTGGRYVQQTSKIDDLFDKFNSTQEQALFYCLDEIPTHVRKYNEMLKDVITRKFKTSEKKGFEKRFVKDYTSYFMTTNRYGALQLENGDRRYVLAETSNEFKGNYEYFKQFHEKYEQQEVLDCLLTFLYHKDISQFNPRKIPNSQMRVDAILNNLKPIERVIRELPTVLVGNGNDYRVHLSTLLEKCNSLIRYESEKFKNIRSLRSAIDRYQSADACYKKVRIGNTNASGLVFDNQDQVNRFVRCVLRMDDIDVFETLEDELEEEIEEEVHV